MRFLLLTQYYSPEIGAPQVRLGALARQLEGLGHEVEVITAMPNYPTGRIHDGYRRKLWHREQVENVDVRRVWMYPSMGRGLTRLIGYISFTAMVIPSLLRTRRVDWVLIESPPLTLTIPGLVWARLRKVGAIVNVADLWPDAIVDVGAFSSTSLAVKMLRRMERWAYGRATVVNSVTEGITKDLRSRCDSDKVRFLPNGADTELFHPEGGVTEVAEALGLPLSKLFVYTGNIGISQGLHNVVDAMAIVAEVDPEVTLALIGDGSVRADLEARVASLGIANVVFVDPVPLDTVAAVLPLAAGAVVSLADLPTNQGARPSKMFPAMASGVPVLFAGLSEGARLVEDAGAGLAVANDEPAEIAEAVLRLLDPVEAQEMGASGRKFVVEEYSWSALAKRWVESLPSPPK